MPKRNFKKRALYNLFFLACLSVLIFLVVSTGKEFLNIKEIDNEIDDLNQEIIKLENKKIELSELLEYFDSDAFAEKKARTELGLKMTDEKVVEITRLVENEEVLLKNEKTNSEPKSNFSIWWNYFFKKN